MLRVSVLTYRGVSITESLVMELDGQAGAIGRDEGNQLVLPDPDRHLSRVQGIIRYLGGEYLLFDQGGNPSTVNGRPLGKGHSALLADGDLIGMAEYQLQVSLPHRSQAAPVPRTKSATPSVPEAPPRLEPAASELPTPVVKVLPQIAVPPTPEIMLPQSAQSPAAVDDLELEFQFSSVETDPLEPLESPAVSFASPLVTGLSEGFLVEELVPEQLAPFEDDSVTQAYVPPVSLVQAHAEERCDAATSIPDLHTEVYSAPPPLPAAQASTPTPQAPQADAQVLLDAFLKGLNVPGLRLPDGMTPALMEQIGVSFGAAVRGTVQLLMTRAAMKRNVNAPATVIMSRNNNPLKLCPDANFALSQMFAPQAPERFLGPVEAMQDAYDDIKAHQLGVVAGMHAALDGLLARFRPQELETNLSAKSFLDSVLPANRKAKLWDAYEQHFAQISSEAEANFHTLFGEEFLRAYEEQIERLAQEAQARRRSS